MKIAYLVLAHNSPKVLEQSIAALSADDCAFYIHVDRKSNLDAFAGINGDRVFFTDRRIAVHWGEFSQVEAVLCLLTAAISAREKYDYFVLISGSDYPIKSGRYIREFLAANAGSEFISLVKVPAPGKPISRITTVRYPTQEPVRRFVGRAMAKCGLAQRDYKKYLGELEPYAGSTWWALTRDACEYILEFVKNHPEVVAFFEHVFAADEAFFHTILANSQFKPRIRRNLLYEDTSAQGPHPAMIQEHHIALIERQDKVCVTDMYGSGEALFARKFSDTRLDLPRRIDEMIQRKEARG